MAPAKPRSFTAQLEFDGTALHWTVVRLTFALADVWPQRYGLRVRGDINGFPFRTTLLGDPRPQLGSAGHILVVNKKMQAGAKVRLGDRVRITIEPDPEERDSTAPPELARAMRQVPGLSKWFDRVMSPSARREIAKYLLDAKSPQSRAKRADDIAERLLLTMEGEAEVPPILRAAFAREPLAESGWKQLTSVQRRQHLFGIFNYKSTESRERRAQQAIDACVALAKKRLTRRSANS